MMQLLRGEKTGLNIELLAINFLLVLFFPLSFTYSQVPIYGFCKFTSVPVEAGFDGVFAANFNNDSYTDILLYNPLKKKVVVYAGEQNGAFTLKKINNSPFEISSIQNLTDLNNMPLGHIVISRKSRKLALAKINNNGSVVFSGITKLGTFPENLSFTDANKDGKQEVLISGGAYEGLSVFSEANGMFKEKKIKQKECFSQSVFCDLNNDKFNDIAAFNVVNKKLIFFYNNTLGDFREVRNIQFDKQISCLQTVNLDFDSYQDLAFAKENSINFLFGDSVSSYYGSLSIFTKYKPDKFIFGDFNKDGKLDIAYINVKDSILSVILAKGTREFYPEIIYFQKEGIANVIPFYSKFIDGLAVLSSKGRLYTITKMNTLLDDIKISIGVKPSVLGYFDKNNNGICDFCFVDEFSQSLNFIIRNNAGIPNFFYTVNLYQIPDKIEVDNSDKFKKVFYCYSYGKKLIELVQIDFSKNKIEHSSLYAPGAIKDIKVKHEADKQIANIYVAFTKNNNLGFAQFEFKDYHYIITNNTELVKNAYDAKLAINKTPCCYAWHWKNGKIVLSKIPLNGYFMPENLFLSDVKNYSGITSLLGDIMNLDKDFFVSFLRSGNNNSIVINSEKMTRLIKEEDIPELLRTQEIKKYFVGEGRFNKLKKMFIYNSSENSVFTLDFLKRGKSLIFTKLIDAENAADFFIKNMSGKNFHIVYTDGTDHTINIKKI